MAHQTISQLGYGYEASYTAQPGFPGGTINVEFDAGKAGAEAGKKAVEKRRKADEKRQRAREKAAAERQAKEREAARAVREAERKARFAQAKLDAQAAELAKLQAEAKRVKAATGQRPRNKRAKPDITLPAGYELKFASGVVVTTEPKTAKGVDVWLVSKTGTSIVYDTEDGNSYEKIGNKLTPMMGGAKSLRAVLEQAKDEVIVKAEAEVAQITQEAAASVAKAEEKAMKVEVASDAEITKMESWWTPKKIAVGIAAGLGLVYLLKRR